IHLFGDGSLFFRGVISLNGKSIFVAHIIGSKKDPLNCCDSDVRWSNDGQYLYPGHELTFEQFNQYIDIKMKTYD
ncbi:unnamed protein product, partial [marine sediment metagenome]